MFGFPIYCNELKKYDIILDNLAFHKLEHIRETVKIGEPSFFSWSLYSTSYYYRGSLSALKEK